MKNIIFSAKFTLTPLGVTLVNLRTEYRIYEAGSINFPKLSAGCLNWDCPLRSVNTYYFHSLSYISQIRQFKNGL